MKTRLLSLLLALMATPGWASPVVTIAQGRVSGTTNKGVLTFKGIPYAAPPVRKLRWRPPVPAPRWPDVREASAFGPVCPQAPVTWAGHDLDRTSEDCLTLNVWTPRTAGGARLPGFMAAATRRAQALRARMKAANSPVAAP